MVPTVSQVMIKNKTFPLNHSLTCANYAIYVVIHACIGYSTGKIIMDFLFSQEIGVIL